MSDVKNIWVLKQPVSIEDYDGGDLVEVAGHILLQSEIKELFQRLDVESLTRQLWKLFKDGYDEGFKDGYTDGLPDDSPELDDESPAVLGWEIDKAVAEVLELIGITKEQK